MEFKVFKNKSQGTDKTKLNLAQPTMLFRSLNPANFFIVAKHRVTEDDIVRPDRIATKYFGTTDGLDLILKFNGISDPFSINPGEELWILMNDSPYYKLDSPQMYEDNPIKNQFLQTKRLSKTDQRRVEALKQKYNKENLLPPNVIPLGKKNYEFDGTNVRLGMHVQTDPVVKSILADISPEEIMPRKMAEADLIIDKNDNTQVENVSQTGAGKIYEKALENNSGKFKSSGSGTGAGGAGKIDAADKLGGSKPDGSAPKPKDNNPTNNPDSPCAK